ncbi:membrane protein insertase YidC [Blattabacterium cuenoti]|uniref:membrane protein insertase YidC n=1 Tax=Blattabacterium cuenoti TaxID=1653831 RepID=UPI00163CB823|nr:membrane protein insertase YidC [Blattabacterium cuenoti]
MRDKNLDYNSIIGLFLIFFILMIFTYLFNNNEKNQKVKYVSHEKIDFLHINRKNNENPEKLFVLENKVINIKISSLGGVISDILLKKYKSYNYHLNKSSSNKINKNLFLSKNYSFLYRIFFSNKNGKSITTDKLHFKLFLKKETKKHNIIVLKANNPYGKGFLYYIYKIEKGNKYNVDFFIKTENFRLINNYTTYLDIKQDLIPLEKDKNWENSYTQVYYCSYDNKKNKSSINYLSEKQTEKKRFNNVKWIACKQQFFTTIINPNKILNNIFIDSENISNENNLKKIRINTLINKNSELNFFIRFYFGPLDFNLLKKYKNNYEDIIPFGWGFLKWINKYFFLTIFQFLEKTNLNYGVIIILMTIVVKLLLSPITYKQYKLSAIMKLIRPDIEKINEEKDILKKQKKMIDLYKKSGINPMSGCLSALLQIPIFYSLFKFFPTLINLRGKSFLWVDDLTSYDSILELPFFIPFYGNHVSLLTLLYSLALVIYTKLSNNGSNLNINNNYEYNPFSSNMNYMLYIMPIIMLLFINSYASALSLYYFTSNIINIGFFFFIKKFFLNEKKLL